MVEPSAPPSADDLFQQWKQFLDAGAQRARGYHSLAIDVTPTRITAWLDDRPMGTIDWPLPADLELDFAEAARLNPGTRSDFSPAGGYGLLAYGGSASFRRATVRASPPP